MLVVTGTQRSGTSAAALMFQEEGYNLGSNLWDDIAQGGLENEIICAFYREYLGDPTFPFDDFELPTGHANLFAQLSRPVVKFSYLCMNPAFVTIWSKFRPPSKGDSFLVLKRNSRTVIASKQAHPQRFSHDSRLLTQEPATLRGNFLNSLRKMIDLGYPVAVIPFQDLMYHFCINDYLKHIGSNLRIKKSTWEKVIDTSKVHF